MRKKKRKIKLGLIKKFFLTVIFLFSFLFSTNSVGKTACKTSFLNPITDIGWVNLFPLKIGGITIIGSSLPDVPDVLKSPVCICIEGLKIRIGISVSYWEPYRMIESVMDPGCFPSLGFNLSGIIPTGHLYGGVTHIQSKEKSPEYAAQAHFIISPFLYILELLKDVTCGTTDALSLDIAYITEIDPTWQDDKLSLILTPEALLFANPVTGLACVADSVTSTFGFPRDELFWCLGTWYDSVYPFVGNTEHGTVIEGAASVSARLLYKLHRMLLVKDAATDPCGEVLAPIWAKSHWRFQPVRPKSWTARSARIGQLPETWAYIANLFDPSIRGSDNWAFLLWRKVNCCLGVGTDL